MGKKRQGGASGSSAQIDWKPYLAVLCVGIAICCFWTVPDNESSSAKSDPKAGVSTADLDAELRRLHVGLSAVAGRGGSGLFGKIKSMADMAQAVLVKADAAKSDDERKQILLEGLSSKSQWMATLQDHALGLKKDDDSDGKEQRVPQAEGAVVALTRENFTNFVAAHPRAMVEFYAPWCPHCRKFAPEYAAVAESFVGRAAFAIVNGEQEAQLTRVYRVGGYPTLKWMIHGRAIDYDGPPMKDKLTEWVESRLTPAYVELDSVEDAATVMANFDGDSKKGGRICAGEGTKESRRFQAFVVAAEHFRGKMIFTWSPPASSDSKGSLRLHSSGFAPDVCGSHAGGKAKDNACEDADDVIKWLEERIDLDPDLQ